MHDRPQGRPSSHIHTAPFLRFLLQRSAGGIFNNIFRPAAGMFPRHGDILSPFFFAPHEGALALYSLAAHSFRRFRRLTIHMKLTNTKDMQHNGIMERIHGLNSSLRECQVVHVCVQTQPCSSPDRRIYHFFCIHMRTYRRVYSQSLYLCMA
jgi:hypothetical protein